MASAKELLRVALIGKTGAGKSALGNTLLGTNRFKSLPAGESITRLCDVAIGTLPSGRIIKVVDTPGILDTRHTDVRDEVIKSIAYLSPGPHAFIIVLSPFRATDEERKVLRELNDLFGDDLFLQHTLLVMVRKNELRDEDGNPVEIHRFMETMAADDVRELYEQCGRRVVAVENLGSKTEKPQYAREIETEIEQKMDGFYAHAYFQLLQEKKIREEEVAVLRREIENLVSQNGRSFCNLL